MKKAILLSASIIILAAGMSSCKKCYLCSINAASKGSNAQDTTIVLKTELCNKGSLAAGSNLKEAVSEVEANGYICKPE